MYDRAIVRKLKVYVRREYAVSWFVGDDSLCIRDTIRGECLVEGYVNCWIVLCKDTDILCEENLFSLGHFRIVCEIIREVLQSGVCVLSAVSVKRVREQVSFIQKPNCYGVLYFSQLRVLTQIGETS